MHTHTKWDMLIAHPPCTYLSNAGAARLYKKIEGKSYCELERLNKGFDAKAFFLEFWNAPIERIAVENPIPSGVYRLPKYTQIVQPYEYGHPYSKKTCLWLKGLPRLQATEILQPICSWVSDSLACLGAIEELGWPLDRIVHAEVWATDEIPADLPPMVEFKAKADAIIKERWGIEVEHIRHEESYESMFYSQKKKGKFIGEIKGFPITRNSGGWCKNLKVMNKLNAKGCVSYVGIAADEPNRFHNLTEVKRSPLIEAGWDEAYCRQYCQENGLLSPIYTTSARGGCWFCHNQGVGQLRLIRKNYPDLWALMLKWDKDSPVTFKADGHTVHDYDRRFQMEDEGLLFPDDKVFRWAMLDDYTLTYRLF